MIRHTRDGLSGRERSDSARRRAGRCRVVFCAGALVLGSSPLACESEDDLAVQCLAGNTRVCERLCAAGRRGKGGCLTLAIPSLETDRLRGRAMLRDICDAKHPAACKQAYDALGKPQDGADRETGRELSTRMCEGRGRGSDERAHPIRERDLSWSTDPCLRAADLWLLDDPERAGALLERFCTTSPIKQVDKCLQDARVIASELGPSAASCRGGDADGCTRFLDGFFVLRPYVPSPSPLDAPSDLQEEDPYPDPKPDRTLGSRWPWRLEHARILAAGKSCAIRGLDQVSLWPPARSLFHDGLRVTHYYLEDSPALCCGFRWHFMRIPQHHQIRTVLANATVEEHVTEQAFIRAGSTVEAGPVTQVELSDGIASVLPTVRRCYRHWIQRVEEGPKPPGSPKHGQPAAELWMTSDHPLYIDKSGSVWHVGRRAAPYRAPPRGWLVDHSREAARRLQGCADAALWSARFPRHDALSQANVRLSFSRAPLGAEEAAGEQGVSPAE